MVKNNKKQSLNEKKKKNSADERLKEAMKHPGVDLIADLQELFSPKSDNQKSVPNSLGNLKFCKFL